MHSFLSVLCWNLAICLQLLEKPGAGGEAGSPRHTWAGGSVEVCLPREENVDKSQCVFVEGCAYLGCSSLNRPFSNLLSMLFS